MPWQLDTPASGGGDGTNGSIGGQGKNGDRGGSDGGSGNGRSRLRHIPYDDSWGPGRDDQALAPIPRRKRGILGCFMNFSYTAEHTNSFFGMQPRKSADVVRVKQDGNSPL